jgi:hypothetical protein
MPSAVPTEDHNMADGEQNEDQMQVEGGEAVQDQEDEDEFEIDQQRITLVGSLSFFSCCEIKNSG